MFLADMDIDRLVGGDIFDLIFDLYCSGAINNHPMFRTMRMALQGQGCTRIDMQALDLIARQVGKAFKPAPRAVILDMLAGLRHALLFKMRNDLTNILAFVGMRDHHRIIGSHRDDIIQPQTDQMHALGIRP